MKKIVLYGIVAVVILVAAFFVLNNYIYTQKQGDMSSKDGYDDLAYVIDGKTIDLQDGTATVDGATYSLWGEEAEGDITEDGIADLASILVREQEATSTSYYLVAAVRADGAYQGVNGVLLGNDITPLGLESKLGGMVVRFTRNGETTDAATSTPARERSRFFVVINGELQSMVMPEIQETL